MNSSDVKVVRIYITESSHLLDKTVRYLKQEANIRGISVFRAISGSGEGGDLESSLIDLSLDLPLVIEFFDTPDKVESALEYLKSIIKPKHILSWSASINS